MPEARDERSLNLRGLRNDDTREGFSVEIGSSIVQAERSAQYGVRSKPKFELGKLRIT